MLVQKVERILQDHDFDTFSWHGCFDILAKKRQLMLLKVLDNVDSFQDSQATNLKILSENLQASVSLIGTHTRTENLEDKIIYERFDVPTFTPTTLESILDSEFPEVYRDKGGLFCEIDPIKLRKARMKIDLTQNELATRVGITKKSIYEHESRRMKAKQKVVGRLRALLKEDLSVPFSFSTMESSEENLPKKQFEKEVSKNLRKIGFITKSVYQTPFNIIAREKVLVLSNAEENKYKAKKNQSNLVNFSQLSDKPVLVITKEKCELEVPSIKNDELKDLTTIDIKKIIKSW